MSHIIGENEKCIVTVFNAPLHSVKLGANADDHFDKKENEFEVPSDKDEKKKGKDICYWLEEPPIC